VPKSLTLEERVIRQLRKTPKSLSTIAAEVSTETAPCSRQRLAKVIPKLVESKQAVKHDARTPTYSKP
jgi:hypothetical protein